MLAMMRTPPPHLLHVSMYPRAPSLDAAHQFTLSMLKTSFSLCAQVIEKVRPGTGREAGLGHARCSASVGSWCLFCCPGPSTLAPLGRCDPRPIFAMGRDYSMVPGEVDPGPGDQRERYYPTAPKATVIASPLTPLDSSEARNAITSATSCGVATRPGG